MSRVLFHRFFALLVTSFLAFTPVMASFDEPGAGARGAGLADAGTALADDASAPFYNPAGLVQLDQRRLTAEMSQQNRGLSDGSSMSGAHVGYAQPLSDGKTIVGVGYRSFGVTDLIEERTYLVGAGRRLSLDKFKMDGVLSIGGNLKMLERAFRTGAAASNAFNDAGAATGKADPLLAGGASASTYGLDAGVLYQFGPKLNSSLGLSLMNFNRPDIGLKDTDKVSDTMKIGAAHRPKWGVLTGEIRRVRRLAGAADTEIALGAERHFRAGYRSAFTLRGGYAQGTRGYKAMTAGASYHVGRFDFDYAFSFPIGNLTDLDGSQRMGVSMKFGGKTAAIQPVTRYESADLIRSFESNSLTAHLLMTENNLLSAEGRSLMNRLLARRFTLDDPGLAKAAADIRDAMKDGRDWSSLVAGFTRDMFTEDTRRAAESLEAYAAGDINTTLARVALLSPDAQKRPSVMSLQTMALGERAAESFRSGKLTITMDSLRRLAILLPASEPVKTALRQLETLQATPPAPKQAAPVETPASATPVAVPVVVPVAAPEPVVAPTPAPAPEPVVVPTVAEPAVTPAVAPVVVEPVTPVAAPVVAPKPAASAPVATPMKKQTDYQPSTKPAARPAEVERAWTFYREAVSREVSDAEKIEILEGMLNRFGDIENGKVRRELDRLRGRAGKNDAKTRSK